MADSSEEEDGKKRMAFTKGGFEEKAFETLEREFQEVLQELQGDRHLDRFRAEYEKLHRALKRSYESEKRLIKKCRELNDEIVTNAGKIQNALQLNEEDQNLIVILKQEIDKAWKMVDASQEKEAKAKDNIQQLKLEIKNLSGIVEQGVTLASGQDTQVHDLEKEKEEVSKERDMQVNQILELRNELTDLSEKIKLSETAKINLEHELSVIQDQLSITKGECDREVKKKERMEKEIRELKKLMEDKQNEVKTKHVQVLEGQELIIKLEGTLRDQRSITEKAVKEFESANQKVTKMQGDLEEQINGNTQLLAENSQKQVEIKLKDDEIEVLKQEIVRVNKLRESTMNKLKGVEKQKEDVDRQREELHNQMISLERDLEVQRKLVEQEHRQLDESVRERDILNKMKTQAEDASSQQAGLVKINELHVKNLEIEVQQYKYAAGKQDKLIEKLEKERQKHGAEASSAASQYMQAMDAVRDRELSILECQKKLVESEAKIKQQQYLYETVRTERNLYSKNLVEAQDEIDEMKRKFKIMNHLVEQLKEEINNKDQALIREHLNLAKVEKEREALKGELGKANLKLKDAESKISEHLSKIENLNSVVAEADDEKLRQEKELEVVKSERDILAAQLIRRNEELALLYEKIRIQQSTLHKGNVQYQDRVNEVRILKIKLTDLKREHALLTGSVRNIHVLKREVHNLGRELIQERTKVKALSEELENPLNVHRWRKLEGTDPTSYELILKIQTLQKRMILKTEEVVEKDLLIQEKEKLYIELRGILARQPGPEASEQLTNYSRALVDRARQLKAMASELRMCQQQIHNYKSEIQDMHEEMVRMKLKYFKLKRKDQVMTDQKSKGQPWYNIPDPATGAPIHPIIKVGGKSGDSLQQGPQWHEKA